MPLSRRAALLLAALPLMGAAPVRAPEPLYPAARASWAGPLTAALGSASLTASLTPGLAALNPGTPDGLRAAAPLVAHLQGSLGYRPAVFAALPAEERHAAVALAAETAREELRTKAYELSEQARALGRVERPDKEQRAELYGLVARLSEMREHYRAFLDDAEAAVVEAAYASAAGQAWEVRRALLGEAAAAFADEAAPSAPRAPPAPLKPSSSAAALRARMEATKNGWGQDDLRALYLGYGFVERQGGKHRFYTHPDFPQLYDTISRQNELPPGYAHGALKIIAQLERLSAQPTTSAADGGPPARPALEDLAVLLSPPSGKPKPAKDKPLSVPARVEAKARPRRESPAPDRETPADEAQGASEVRTLQPHEPAPPRQTTQTPPPAKTAEPEGLLARLRKLLPRLR